MQNWIDCEPGISTSWTNVPGGTMPAGHFDSHPVSAIAHHRSHNLETGWLQEGLQGMQWQRLPVSCMFVSKICIAVYHRERDIYIYIISIGLGIVGRTQHAMWSMSIAAGTVSGQEQNNNGRATKQSSSNNHNHVDVDIDYTKGLYLHNHDGIKNIQWRSCKCAQKRTWAMAKLIRIFQNQKMVQKKCCILCCAQQLHYIMYKRWDMCISVCI